MIIANIEQGSEAWHQNRIGKITGTRFKLVVAGKSTAGYTGLISELAGEIITEEKVDGFKNEAMERGTALESEARKEYENIMDTSVEEVGFVYMEGYEEWVGVSPDGLCNPGMVEYKCPLIKTHLNYIAKNVLPSEYKWQVQGNLMVTGADYCDFMSYFPGLKPFIIRVEPDPEMHRRLKEEIDIVIEEVGKVLEIYKNYEVPVLS